jgi:hypothetical protein
MTLKPGNDLYTGWLDYILSLSDEDIKEIVQNGLKHQALALRNMIRELIAGEPVQKSLVKKLEKLVILTNKNADLIRR